MDATNHSEEYTPEQLKKIEAYKKKQARALKKKEFVDKYFYYDVTVDLSEAHDGSCTHTIRKKKPIALIVSLAAVVLLLIGCLFTIDYKTFSGFKWDQLGAIFTKMFSPLPNSLKTWDAYWDYMGGTAIKDIWTTNEMCFLGTIIGCVLSVPIYYLCAQNINKNRVLRGTVRTINDILRTVPQLVMALILRLFFGASLVTGVLSIAIFTLGIMYQMMYEYVETVEMSPFEAIRSNGGGTIQCILLGIHPQVQPMFFANVLYTFEINIRASVILGYVGAGGYGYALKNNYASGYYDKIGAMMIPLFVEVIFLQIISNMLGRKSR